MKVLFLDVDGVLNSEASASLAFYNRQVLGLPDTAASIDFDPMAVNTLRTLMSEIPDMMIVLSSCWRIGRLDADCSALLTSKGLDGTRCIGRTGHSLKTRGQEVQAYLDDHPEITRFVILDDDSDMGHLATHLVQTSFRVGLTLLHNEEIIKRFA